MPKLDRVKVFPIRKCSSPIGDGNLATDIQNILNNGTKLGNVVPQDGIEFSMVRSLTISLNRRIRNTFFCCSMSLFTLYNIDFFTPFPYKPL